MTADLFIEPYCMLGMGYRVLRFTVGTGRAGSVQLVKGQQYLVCPCYRMPRVLGEMQSLVRAWQEIPELRTEDTGLGLLAQQL